MIDPEMLRITRINGSVVTAPQIGMNNRLDADTSVNTGLQRFSPDVRDDFGKDFAVAFINTENVIIITAFIYDIAKNIVLIFKNDE